jgi:hypothetical protein
MSEGCTICKYRGGPDPEHIEHAHRVAMQLGRMLADQAKKHNATIAVLSGQKKNALLLGMSNEITRLRGELLQAMRVLESRTERLKAQAAGEAPCPTT